MKRRVACVLSLAVVLHLACGHAGAALLWDDPAAMAKGTQTFFATGGGFTLNVDLHFAVYAPDDYPGTDPSDQGEGGTDYVYAYQIFNDINEDATDVATLTVGLLTGSGAQNAGTDTSVGAPGQSGGVGTVGEGIGVSGVSWYFTDLIRGEHSVLLLFTSPNGPHSQSASVVDGGLSDTRGGIPSPAPEPATLALLAVGGAVLIRRRLRSTDRADMGRR